MIEAVIERTLEIITVRDQTGQISQVYHDEAGFYDPTLGGNGVPIGWTQEGTRYRTKDHTPIYCIDRKTFEIVGTGKRLFRI